METRAIVIKVAHKMGLLSHLSQLFRMLEVQGKVYTKSLSLSLFLLVKMKRTSYTVCVLT